MARVPAMVLRDPSSGLNGKVGTILSIQKIALTFIHKCLRTLQLKNTIFLDVMPRGLVEIY